MISRALFLSSLCLLLLLLVPKCTGKCVMYEQCGINNHTGESVPCKYDGEGKVMENKTVVANLQEVCYNIDTSGPLCCTAEQATLLIDKVSQAKSILGGCPTCYLNYLKTFCAMACDPNQSEFLRVDATQPDKDLNLVTNLTYFMANHYMEKTIESCRYVQFAQTTMPALLFICNSHVDDCTPTDMAEVITGNSPYYISFKFSDTDKVADKGHTYTVMNSTAQSCSEPPYPGGFPCGCSDCPCNMVPLTPDSCMWLIGNVSGMFIVMGVVFFVLLVAFITFSIIRWKPSREPSVYVNFPPIGVIEKKTTSERLDEILFNVFYRWGKICSNYRLTVILVSLALISALGAGCVYYQVITDPVELWSAPNSQARVERDHFNHHFSPFYRTEQVIVTRTAKNESIFDLDFFHKVTNLQTDITSLKTSNGVGLVDICYQPVKDGVCAVMSAFNYFQNTWKNVNETTFKDTILTCANNPLNETCLGDYGGIVFGDVALGGFKAKEYGNATAFVITIPVNNHVNSSDNEPAMAWEDLFINFMKNFSDPDMEVFFNSERSITDELARASHSDILTIALSYMIMFIYVVTSLGKYHSYKTFFLRSKFTLGLCGILMVLASVAAAIGIYSYLNVPSTLIIIEVIPFLVLAVGVDNIVILVHAFERYEAAENESVQEQIAQVLGKVGPSLLLSAMSQVLCFFLGSFTPMPAVRIFALYASMALLINFLLQISCFVTFLTIDAKRQQAKKADILCCVNINDEEEGKSEGFMFNFFKNRLAPVMMKKKIRTGMMIIFLAWLCSSVALINQVEVGLDQQLSMPKDSYVLKYFQGLSDYLAVGPPVYLVVKEPFNYTDTDNQNLFTGGVNSYRLSIQNQVTNYANQSNITFLAHPTNNWLGDYFSWINNEGCCRFDTNVTNYCHTTSAQWGNCTACKDSEDIVSQVTNRPTTDQFLSYAHHFLSEIPTRNCPVGGKAAYKPSIQFVGEGSNQTIAATNLMTFHSTLKTSSDFISALKWARNLSSTLTDMLQSKGVNTEVYAYSIFYVFYEQYLTIWTDTIRLLTISVLGVFLMTLLLTGLNYVMTILNTAMIVAILLNMMGLMYWMNIPLNAVSLVNLVMSVGIAVEFCSHITRAFIVSKKRTRLEKAEEALANMGSSVLSGITLTKFGGIIVLAFASSQIFVVFYFRMYAGIVLCGATHGIIFLPIILSYLGPEKSPSSISKSIV